MQYLRKSLLPQRNRPKAIETSGGDHHTDDRRREVDVGSAGGRPVPMVTAHVK
jgi:hypothetical protein